MSGPKGQSEVSQVADEHHPEHIQGNGPEQDYLSSCSSDTVRTLLVLLGVAVAAVAVSCSGCMCLGANLAC